MPVLPSVSTPEQNRTTTQCHKSIRVAVAGPHDRQFPDDRGTPICDTSDAPELFTHGRQADISQRRLGRPAAVIVGQVIRRDNAAFDQSVTTKRAERDVSYITPGRVTVASPERSSRHEVVE